MILHYPQIIREKNGERFVYDIASCLLQERIVLVDSEINTDFATSIIGQLLYLESEDSEKPITMYINSPGGSISDGLAIYDVMNKIKAPIVTIAMGMAASMAAFLLCSGSRGKRYALPNATVMIHQPLGAAEGQATDILIRAKRIDMLRTKMYNIMSNNCGQDFDTVAKACERDNYLSPEEALNFGLIDEIIDCPPKAFKKKEDE